MKIPKSFLHIIESNTRLIPMIGILLLAIAVPITLNLIEKNQDNRQQAAVSTQSLLSGQSCEELSGECVEENDANPAHSCFSVVLNGVESGCKSRNEVCCVKKNPTTENSTCLAESEENSCDYDYTKVTECEEEHGAGNCEMFEDLDCINNKVCFSVKTSSSVSPTVSPSPSTTISPSPDACEIGKDGKQYCCPVGSKKVGKTDNTFCPQCQKPGETYIWTAFECSLGNGSCSVPTDCENLENPCGQQTPVWECINNNSGTGKHCAHSCTPLTQ
jgi:hypothetical protein